MVDQQNLHLQLESHHDGLHHLTGRHAGALHLLGEDGGHEDVGGGADPETVGEAGDDEARDGEIGEAGLGEAEAEEKHAEASEREEDGVEIAAVQPGQQEGREEVAKRASALKIIEKTYPKPN